MACTNTLVSQPPCIRRNAQSSLHMGFPTSFFMIIIRLYQNRIKTVSTPYQHSDQSMSIAQTTASWCLRTEHEPQWHSLNWFDRL